MILDSRPYDNHHCLTLCMFFNCHVKFYFMRPVLLVLISFVAVTALPSGLLMMYYSDGSLFGLSPDLLIATPFKSYFVPGLILALVIGGSSLMALFLIMNQSPFSYRFALFSGIVLMIWIFAEFILFPYRHWLQGLYLGAGILIALTSYQLLGKAAI